MELTERRPSKIVALAGTLLSCQRLRKISQEIVRMLDADRQANRRVPHADACPHVGGDTRVRGRARVAGERLGPTETDRQLEDLHSVETAERLPESAPDVQGQGGSWCGAL